MKYLSPQSLSRVTSVAERREEFWYLVIITHRNLKSKKMRRQQERED